MTMDNNTQRPKTIFEQIALGLQVTNENIVEVSKDIALLHSKIDAIYATLFPTNISEPTSAGAEQSVVGGSTIL